MCQKYIKILNKKPCMSKTMFHVLFHARTLVFPAHYESHRVFCSNSWDIFIGTFSNGWWRIDKCVVVEDNDKPNLKTIVMGLLIRRISLSTSANSLQTHFLIFTAFLLLFHFSHGRNCWFGCSSNSHSFRNFRLISTTMCIRVPIL